MNSDPPILIIADVRVSEDLDRLVITPRDPNQARALSAALASSNLGRRLKRDAEGISVPAEICEILSSFDLVTDLRWTTEAQLFVRNRHRAKIHHARLKREIEQIKQGQGDIDNVLSDVRGLDILDRHQRTNIAAMTLPNSYGLCVFDEQGAGKTVTFIFAFDVLVERDRADIALVIAPKSMISEWKNDFHRFMGDLYKIEMVVGTREQKSRALRSGADVLVTNYETVVTMEAEMRALLRRHQGRAVLAVDESFYAKNLDAKRTMALRRLREWCKRAYVLCGTPAPNSPYDIVQQFNITDFGLTFDGLAIPDDPLLATTVIQETIKEKGLYTRHLKTEVLPDLPSKTFHRVLIPMQPEQIKLYRVVLKDLICDLQSVSDKLFHRQLHSFLAKRSTLLQICSNPLAIVEGYTETPAKLYALDDLLDSLVRRNSQKVVVWSFFTASLNAIFERYSHLNPVRYDGSITDVSARRNAVAKFQEDEATMLFVANPAAAGTGLTLHSARFAIYESMSNQTAHYLQSLDRIHRRGQTRPVEYLVLLCDRTIEVPEYERLVRKGRSAEELFYDPVDVPITRQSMLREVSELERVLDVTI